MRTLSLGCVLAATVAASAACTAPAEDVQPSPRELFFPTGAAVAPDDSVLFVANANSELRFDSGTLTVFPLGEVDAVVDGWLGSATAPAGCGGDFDHRETLNCDEAVFLTGGYERAGVRIGNFATDIALQDLKRGDGSLRVIVPTRGDPSVAWADWDATRGRLECTAAANEGFGLCDDDHRLSFALGDADLVALPEEPFGVFADSQDDFAVVTHLTTGAVTLIDSPRGGFARITDIVRGVFLPDASGLRGATSVAGRTPNAAGDIVYVGSRTEDRIQMFTVGRPVDGAGQPIAGAAPYLIKGSWFFLDGVGTHSGGSSDTRGMVFSKDGNRLYLVNRRPPSLQILDTSIGPTGVPRNVVIGAVDICRQASTVAVAGTGDDERVYVTCFQDGQVYVVDPRGTGRVDDIMIVGRGPYAITAAPTRGKLYVTNFLEDTVAVIDIRPSSPTRNRVVLRVGIPRHL